MTDALHYDESDRRTGGGWPPDLGPETVFNPPFPAPTPAVAGLGDAPPSVRPGQPGNVAGYPPPGNPAGPVDPGGPVDPFLSGPAPAVTGAASLAAADQATILPTAELLTLVSGTKVRIRPLRTRELLAIYNIGVSGLTGQLAHLNPDPDEPTDVFLAKFAGMMLAGLGAAGDEAMAFLRMVCEPADKVSTFRPDKAQKMRNAALDAALDEELHNPHPDDTISIIEAVAAMNGGDLQAWGKRLAGIARMFRRTGQTPASPTSAVSTSSAR